MLITKLIVNRVIGETMPDMMSPPWSVCGRGEERYCDGGARRLVTDLSVNHVTGESMPDTINYLRELGPLLTPDYPSREVCGVGKRRRRGHWRRNLSGQNGISFSLIYVGKNKKDRVLNRPILGPRIVSDSGTREKQCFFF